jgi:chromosomal replication initiation ATPase DnaA
MSKAQEAKILIDGEVLSDIVQNIEHDYFELWQVANTLEDRERIHAKQAALSEVFQAIIDKANEVLN